MAIDRILTNIASERLAESRDFYVALLGFAVNYDSDWYVQLKNPAKPDQQLGIILRTSELLPAEYQRAPTGMYVTFVVDDVDAAHERALELGVPILQEPRDEFYGQRRFLTVDPSGCLVDVCSPVAAGAG